MVKVANIYCSGSDAVTLAAFYRETLGLTEKFADDARWIQFDVNGVSFAVAGEAESAAPPGAGAVVTFEVDDLRASLANIVSEGGTQVGEIRNMGSHGLTASCKDPAGNLFQLLQR